MPYYKDEEVLIPNTLKIYRIDRKNSKGWFYCYINIKGTKGRIRKSLGTTRRDEAKRKAHNLYNEVAALASQGLPILATSFKELSSRYALAADLSDTSIRRLKVLGWYFDEFKDVRDVTSSDITKYYKFRECYWESEEGKKRRKRNKHHHTYNVSHTTIRMEITLLMSMLKWAKDRAIIPFVPETRVLKKARSKKELSYKRRGEITDEIHDRIWRAIDLEYRAINRSRKNPLHSSFYHHKRRMIEKHGSNISDEFILDEFNRMPLLKNRRMHIYIHSLHKGWMIRTQEWKKIKWGNINSFWNDEIGKEVLEVFIDEGVSKNNISRRVFIIDHGTLRGDKQYGTLATMLKEWRNITPNNKDDDYVFCNIYAGSSKDKPAEMGVYFSKLLKKMNLRKNKEGLKLSSYSYRHMGISNAIRKGYDVYTISKIADTSVQQINKHYEHSKSAEYLEKVVVKEEKHIQSKEKRSLTAAEASDLRLVNRLFG